MNDDAIRQHLESSGALDAASLEEADQYARSRRRPLAEAIVELGLLSDTDVYRKGVAPAAGLKFVDVGSKRIPDAVVQRLPGNVAIDNRTVPVADLKGVLFVAIDDPERVFVLDNLGFVAGGEVRAALCTPAALERALEDYYGDQKTVGARGKSAEALGEDDAEAPIIRLVHQTIEEAMAARASDIHIEPFEESVRVRYRVDGVLREVARHPKNLQGSLISRLKIMASLDIAEKRKPQDGRILFRAKGRDIDIRTSILPGNHGESIVMRLLDKDEGLVSLAALGFSGDDHDTFQRLIKRPNGIFLVTGPTGSGKTTTLYAALRELNRPDVKIITAEDPVEYHIGGINQCQVRHQIGLDFSRILRAMLRQAPNIILVGEIRDPETAEIAIQAALTGHLVFSTLHTNDAPSALARLIDMGVKPFLVAASIQAVLAQRLLRMLCPNCKKPHEPEVSELRQIGLTPEQVSGVTLYEAFGCEACGGNGYRGRRGIFELMVMDDEIREMTFRREPTLKIRGYAESSIGMKSLVHDGARKVIDGQTSVDEVLRVVASK
ncbi:MAG: ATPase, T2SS/T4P/T4SS family [Planctomycetota bacterium]|jgi:type IV pilus assembly protein PilB|nr:ATPase, T2SS/T4P/T4SS family [Planctomycetota bacterium]